MKQGWQASQASNAARKQPSDIQQEVILKAREIQGTFCPACGAPAPSVQVVQAAVQSLKFGRRKAEVGRKEFMDTHAAATYDGKYTLRDMIAYHPDKMTVSTLSRHRKKLLQKNGRLPAAASRAAASRAARPAAANRTASRAAVNRAANRPAANRPAANRAAARPAATRAAAARAAASRTNNTSAANSLLGLRTLRQPARATTTNWANVGAAATLLGMRRRV